MQSQFPDKINQRIERCGAIAVLVIDDVRTAVPLAEALLAGGIDAIELTLRTPAAIPAAEAIANHCADLLVGIGTVLTPEQIKQCVDVGASFAVAPGLNRRVVEQAQEQGLPFAPGVVTPSDIEQAVELGCRDLKFFPAEPSGGLAYLRSMAAPYQHLGLRFIPLGGLNVSHLEDYTREPLIAAVGGSWIAPRKLIEAEDWEQIIANAREARQIIDAARQGAKGNR